MAVIYEARRSPAISAEPLSDEELFLLSSPEAAERAVSSGLVPARRGAPLAAISQLDIILPGREHGLRRALQRAGVRPDPARLLEVDSLTAIRTLVRQGAGWSVLPRAGLTAEDHAGLVIRPLGEPALRARLMLAFSANRPVTLALRALTGFLKSEVAQLQARGIMSAPLS
jgi:LysR family nitrogen assimilation transcriptional regulator